MAELKEISIDKIEFSETNPRTKLDNDEIGELAHSIKANKLYQPILTRKIHGKYECVDGERRLRACKQLKWNKIPALIDSLTDEQVREIQLISFIQRKDIHPLNEANAMHGLIETGKYSIETIADKIGKDKPYVAKRLQLLNLIKDVRDIYIDGKIELGHALLIARLPEKEQQKSLSYIKKQFRIPTVHELKVHIEFNAMINLNNAPFQRGNKLLYQDAGSCNECPKRTGNAVDLFNDFSGKNICSDPGCYKTKVQLHIDHLFVEHEKAEKQLLKISGVNYNDKKETLGQSSYEIVKKAEGKNIIHAVYMDGPQKGHLVNIKKHEPQKSVEPKAPTLKETLEEENEQIRAKRDSGLRQALAKEILTKDIKTAILPQVARAILNMQSGEFISEYFFISDESKISKMNDAAIIETFNGGAIAAASDGINYSYPIEFLIDIAAHFDIDHKAIKTKIWNENQLLTIDDMKKREKNKPNKDPQ